MVISEEANERKSYTFSWEVLGYDCGPPKIKSPKFMVDFEVTDLYMELDLSKLQNTGSCIALRLVRDPSIGPQAVTFDVKISVKLSENKHFQLNYAATKTFSEKERNYLDFDIDISSQKLESIEDDFNWLTSKSLFIDVEIISPKNVDEFPKRVWSDDKSLKALKDHLKKLFSSEDYHDLVLKVKGQELKLHKCILKARWPKLMSNLEIASSKETKVETKEFSGIPHAVLKDMLEFAYCGDLEFMYDLDITSEAVDIFRLARKYNFYRLNNRISQLPSSCSCSQMLQSYRTSVEMKFENVTSPETAIGDFRTCEIPLKPRQLPTSDRPMDNKEREKFQQHIRFMDLRVYVNKDALGYNWLIFSIVLGKLPKNPVTIKCKLYVVGEGNVKHLLTEQNLLFDETTRKTFETAFSKGKICNRYLKVSEPVITWRELTDERNGFMRTRQVRSKFDHTFEEKDIYFRFELKLADGEYLHDTRNGECEFELDWDRNICKDLKSMYDGGDFADIEVISDKTSIRVHKAILAARSSVLKKALELEPKSLPINVHHDCLRVFIEYLYTGQVPEVSDDKIDHLLSVADEYKMECLRNVLENRDAKPNGISLP